MALLPHKRDQDGRRSRLPYSWIIEGDIKGCFDNLSHHHLLTRLRARVADKKAVRLVGQFLKAGVLAEDQFVRTEAGTPQGGIVSPILANIALTAIEERYERWTCRIARATRLAAAPSVLRRAHDHHRDLRAMEAIPRATRERPLVTRHGLRSPHAATPPLRQCPNARPSPRSRQACWMAAAVSSRSWTRMAENLTQHVPADPSVAPVSVERLDPAQGVLGDRRPRAIEHLEEMPPCMRHTGNVHDPLRHLSV